MRQKLLLLAIGILLSLPGHAFANQASPDNPGGQNHRQPCDCGEHRHHHMMSRGWQEEMIKREQKLLTWSEKYTPEKKQEWTQTLEEKKALQKQWMSPANKSKREQWKKEKRARMEELKKQLDAGKITKQEFLQKAHGGKIMKNWKAYHDLEVAVEANNSQHAAQLLNQLLIQYKQHNVMLQELLKK